MSSIAYPMGRIDAPWEAPLLTWLLRTQGRAQPTMHETFQWCESNIAEGVPLPAPVENWGPKPTLMTAHVNVQNERDAIDRLIDRLVEAPEALPEHRSKYLIMLCSKKMTRRVKKKMKGEIRVVDGVGVYGFNILEITCRKRFIFLFDAPKMAWKEQGLLFDPNHLRLRFMGAEKPALDFGDLSSPVGIQCSAPTYRVSVEDIQRWQKQAEGAK